LGARRGWFTADSPRIVGGNGGHTGQETTLGQLRADDHAPTAAVPVLKQGVSRAPGGLGAYSPNVVACDARGAGKHASAEHRSRNHTPGCPVEMLREGGFRTGAAASDVADRPNIAGGNDCGSAKGRIVDERTGNNLKTLCCQTGVAANRTSCHGKKTG